MRRSVLQLVLIALVACLLAPLALAHPTVQVPTGIVIASAKRDIKIATNIEEQVLELRVENKGDAASDYFLVGIPPAKVAHLALVEAFAVKNDAALHATQVSVPSAPAGAASFQVTLAGSLAPGAFSRVRVVIYYTHTLVPFPAAIAQADAQLVEFTDSTLLYVPHVVETQTTTVHTHSSSVESYSPRKGAAKQGSTLTWGPFDTLAAPYAAGEPLYVHSENSHPFATMRTMEKEVEVSHWGNVAVTEHYIIENTGAKLKGDFLRSQYQSPYAHERGRAIISSLPAVLPPQARDVYFRDLIGNISTSHLRAEPGRVFVEIQPRFPLAGGWKTDLEFGYALPVDKVLARSAAAANDLVLDIPFGSRFPSVCVDAATVRVILPEGASNIRWETPFDVDAEGWEVRKTYLDTDGRPVLVLRKNNIVAGHGQPIRVVYTFAPVHLWREPALLVGAVLALLVATMVYVRLDLSFGTVKAKTA